MVMSRRVVMLLVVLLMVVTLWVIVTVRRPGMLGWPAPENALEHLVSYKRHDSCLHDPSVLHSATTPRAACLLLLLIGKMVLIHEIFKVLW
jgi:hypothetical protein